MMKKILTFIFCLLTYSATSCNYSLLQLDLLTPLGGGQYQLDMTMCSGAGNAGGANHTGNFVIAVTGANIVSINPTLTSPQTGGVYTANVVGGNATYTNLITWFSIVGPPGGGHSECVNISMIVDDYPGEVQALGLEAADDFGAGCLEGFVLPHLPIELNYFLGYSDEDCSSTLKWETESEIDASHFIVQRSYDGIDFVNIGYVFSSEEDAFYKNQYRFIDTEPLNVGYYRLNMVDDDGGDKYSAVVQLSSICDSDIIFPNPTNGNPTVDYILVSSIIRDVNIMVTDYLGRIVRWETDTISNQTNRFSFDLTGLPKGIYFIVIDSDEIVKRRPFILN